ncbi:MAG TPA: hypothetical protein VGP82_16450 [Ktedonobacterales bacterium]|nr:hypothetical protein [Ktedonobacterales bacterium]
MTTLRAALAEVYTRPVLDGAPGAQPSEEELHRVLEDATGRKLTAQQAKLLLRTTKAKFDPRAAIHQFPADPQMATQEQDNAPFTVEQIGVLTPALWRTCLAWLLAGEGYTVEEVSRSEESATWHAHTAKRRMIAHAIRLPRGWLLDEEAVQRTAALASGEPGAKVLLLSTAQATVGATLAARRLNVSLWDRAVLQAALGRSDTAYARAQEKAQDLVHEQARAATETRSAILRKLHAIEDALATGENTRKASGRAAVAKVAREVATARAALERATLAWETLVDEWSAVFGERATREGALSIEADTAQLAEIADRATHLSQAAMQGAHALTRTPAAGDSSYVTWRRAVMEAVAASFEALRWRVSIVDPAQWHDFAQAHDEQAAQRAARATTAANHAAARAQKTYAQLA